MNTARRAALLVVSLAAFATAQQPRPESFRPRAFTFDARIDFPAQTLTAAATWELENWTDAPADHVSFLLGRLMEVSRVRDATGAALPFTQDVVRIADDPMRQVDRVLVRLRRAVAANARTTLRIEYAGSIVPYTEVGWLYVRDHIDTAFTIIREDALAFPVVGGLRDDANRKLPRVNFTYDASVRVPAGYVVATGGGATRTPHDDGSVTWRYRSGRASPFLNVSIARFDTLSGSGLHLFVLDADSAGARRFLADGERAIAALTRAFGPLHDSLNLAITEIPDGWGSQADLVGGVIQTAAAFRDSTRIGELYHELSHLWNVAETPSPPSRWSEGLAMFEQHLLEERINGMRRADADSATLARLRHDLATDTLLRQVPFVDYGARRMTDYSYSVGEVMFATLHDLLGDEAFDQLLGSWYQQHAGGGSTSEFVAWLRQRGPRDLSRFVADWLTTTRWTDVMAHATSVADVVAQYR